MSVPTGPLGGPRFDTRGAIDLGALAAAREAQAKREAAVAQARADGIDPAANAIFDVTEETFQTDVIELSMRVPVVVDFRAEWSEPCKQLSPILERLAAEYAGQWALARVDVDAQPRLMQAFQVQGVPALYAVVAGQPVPLFQGVVPEPQIRAVLDELLKLAAENGVTGQVGAPVADESAAPAEPVIPVDPDLDAASDAFAAQDLEAAEAAYRRLLARKPGDPDGTAGLALVGLMRRNSTLDANDGLAAVTANPSDAEARLAAADALVLARRQAEAFTVLIDGVRLASGDDRDRLRVRLLELFDVVGHADPAVAPARSALGAALF